MFFTIKRKRIVRPLQNEIDQFIGTRRGSFGTYSTAEDHKRFIEQFIDSSGISSVEEISDYVVDSFIRSIRHSESTESRRLMATVAIRQFVAYMDRKEIKTQSRKVGRPAKEERNLEMVALRKFDSKWWTMDRLATKYSITKRAVWEVLDRYKDILTNDK